LARDPGTFMRKLALALTAALPLVAIAKDNPDESFLHRAAQAGHAEVVAGQLAQEKASNPAVKPFAGMMVKEHTAANDELGKLAGTTGVALPTGPSSAQKESNRKLEKRSSESFDRDYVASQIKAHEETVSLLQNEIDSGKDADAKAFASETLPKVKAHLEKA